MAQKKSKPDSSAAPWQKTLSKWLEKEDRFRQIFEESRTVQFLLDATDGKIIYANPAAAHYYGYSLDELKKMNIYDINILPHHEIKEVLEEARGAGYYGYEFMHRLASGEIRDVEVFRSPLNINGEQALNSIIFDITERKRDELIKDVLFQIAQDRTVTGNLTEFVQAVRAHLDKLIDTTNFYVALYDQSSGTYTFPYHVDQEDDLDISMTYKLEKSLTDFVRREGKSLWCDEMVHEELIALGKAEMVGKPCLLWLGAPLKTTEGVIGVVTVQSYENADAYTPQDAELLEFVSGYIAVEIERKQAEEELRISEERLQLALAGTNDGLWDWNLTTGEIFHDMRWEEMLGYEPGEVEGKIQFRSMAHPEDQPLIEKLLNEHLEGKTEIFSAEYRMKSKSGEWVWVLDRGKVVSRDENGKPLRMVGTQTDITKRKQAEEERWKLEERIQNAQRMESLGVLAGGVAHDFNNILAAIIGNADLSLLDLPENHPVRDNLHVIINEGRRAAELTKQMLAYSGQGKYVTKSHNLSEVIQRMQHFLQTSVSKKVKLEMKLTRELPPIHADHSQMQQMILNLVNNASEAIGDKAGTVVIRTGEMLVDEEFLRIAHASDEARPGEFVFMSIEDDGCGIDDETMQRIFEPFFSTKFIGRGLGLSAVHGIVRSHEGAITVESKPNEVTKVLVLLPVEHEDETCMIQPPGISTNGDTQQITVLLADDEKTVLDMIAEYLNRAGYSVLFAHDGGEVVKIFREKQDQIDVILLDYKMSVLNGEEAMRKIREISPTVPVILTSGYSEEEATGEFKGLNLTGFIQKPFTKDDLLDIIRSTYKLR